MKVLLRWNEIRGKEEKKKEDNNSSISDSNKISAGNEEIFLWNLSLTEAYQ